MGFDALDEEAEGGSLSDVFQPVVIEDIFEGRKPFEVVGFFEEEEGICVVAEEGVEATEVVIGMDVAEAGGLDHLIFGIAQVLVRFGAVF